jgi:L-ribulose-5-phosphate 3-epimerase UlaE
MIDDDDLFYDTEETDYDSIFFRGIKVGAYLTKEKLQTLNLKPCNDNNMNKIYKFKNIIKQIPLDKILQIIHISLNIYIIKLILAS